MDAICFRAVAEELRKTILGARIDKIQQPTRDQIVLLLPRAQRLLINAGTNQPRIQLTRLLRENPAQPPMFCMLLRKHLTGAKIIDIAQPEMERIIILTLEGHDELGEVCRRQLVLEGMGGQSNLILLDSDARIIDCMRRVDLDLSEKRQLLPGLFYHLPPAQNAKRSPLSLTEADALLSLLSSAPKETQLDRWLLDTFFGLSPLLCRELAYRACGVTDCRIFSLDDAAKTRLNHAFTALLQRIRENDYAPTLLVQDDRPMDFACVPITQYENAADCIPYSSLSTLLDDFYEKRERTERMRQLSHDLRQTASSARDRIRRKLAIQEKEYQTTQERDALRKAGDLITANLYRMERGAQVLQAEDYDTDGCPLIDIRLDPLLTPQQNAAKYYKQYNKAKTAERILQEQMEKGRMELDYLESIIEELREAESEHDLRDIRAELKDAGYLKGQRSEKKQPKRALKPRVFRSSTGLLISVGRNNTQNDQLTCRDAAPGDIWFHTQKIHGSHVILHTAGAPADNQSMTEAAMLAAYYSQAREGQNVPVDYTPVRYVKKPAGAKPGMVIYTTYQTAYVTPQEALVKDLALP